MEGDENCSFDRGLRENKNVQIEIKLPEVRPASQITEVGLEIKMITFLRNELNQ